MNSSRPNRQRSAGRNLVIVVLMAFGVFWPHDARAGSADGTGATCCPCDCSGDHSVTVDEILRSANVVLSGGDAGTCINDCPPSNLDVAYVVSCVSFALTGCPASNVANAH